VNEGISRLPISWCRRDLSQAVVRCRRRKCSPAYRKKVGDVAYFARFGAASIIPDGMFFRGRRPGVVEPALAPP